MTRLTPTHHLLLAQGAQDPAGLIDLPSRLRGAAAKAVVAKLMAAGLIAEVFAPAERAWRNDEAGKPVGLTLTPAGRDALGPVSEAPAATEVEEGVVAPEPRVNAKCARVMEMLAWGGGASLDEITAATGWLPHSARAMLSGLRRLLRSRRRSAGVQRRCSQQSEPLAPRPSWWVASLSTRPYCGNVKRDVQSNRGGSEAP